MRSWKFLLATFLVQGFSNSLHAETPIFADALPFGESAVYATAEPTGSVAKVIVKTWETNRVVSATINPYPGYTMGINMTLGPVIGTGTVNRELNIITAPKSGAAPHVNVYSASGAKVCQFYAFHPSFTGGVNLTTITVSPGKTLLVVAAGPGGGPHVKLLDLSLCSLTQGPVLVQEFFAYPSVYNGGVWVSDGTLLDGTKFLAVTSGSQTTYPVKSYKVDANPTRLTYWRNYNDFNHGYSAIPFNNHITTQRRVPEYFEYYSQLFDFTHVVNVTPYQRKRNFSYPSDARNFITRTAFNQNFLAGYSGYGYVQSFGYGNSEFGNQLPLARVKALESCNHLYQASYFPSDCRLNAERLFYSLPGGKLHVHGDSYKNADPGFVNQGRGGAYGLLEVAGWPR